MKNKLLSSMILLGSTALSFGNCPSTIEKTVWGSSLKENICTTLANTFYLVEAPEALSAVNIRNTTFGARWSAVSGATAYLLDVSTTPFSAQGENDDATYLYKDLNVGNVTFYTVPNLMADTPYYYRLRAIDGETVSDYSNIISVFTTAVSVWDGSMWTDNEPNATINAILDAPYDNLVNGNFTARTLTINSSGSMKVRSGTNFTVLSGITNNASPLSFVIENNANLLQTGTINNNSGSVTVKREAMMKRLDYVYWSAPVEGQNLKAFSSSTLEDRFYELNETTNSFAYVNPNQNEFIAAKGISIRAPNNFTTTNQVFNGTFTGKPNSGTISIPLHFTGSGFNLIGNPYPSTITTDLFLAENPAISTLYFFTHTISGPTNGGNYATYNSTGSIEASATGSETPNETIQTGQGFIAKVSEETTAVFLNSMRVANNENQFFRGAQPEKHRIWLTLENTSGRVNQMLVGYVEGATNGIDNRFDSKSMTAMTNGLTSLTASNDQFVIQGKALPFSETDTVKLGLITENAGSYTIRSTKFDGIFAETQPFYLRDNLTGLVTDLKEAPYTFTTNAGTFNERFEVVYENVTLGITPSENITNEIIAYSENGALKITSANEDITSAQLYDITGRLLYEKTNLTGQTLSVEGLKVARGPMIIKVMTATGNKLVKKIIY